MESKPKVEKEEKKEEPKEEKPHFVLEVQDSTVKSIGEIKHG
jgi:hypothetical protein